MKRAGAGSSADASARRARSAFLLAGALLLALCSQLAAAAEEVSTLRHAGVLLDDSTAPPGDAAAWRALTLPDNWNLSRPGVGGYAWYRLRFNLAHAPAALQAIYIRKLSMNAEFHLNGVLLGSGGRMDEPVARNWHRPLFFTIPPSLLREGENVLHVRLRAYPNSRGGLGAIAFGPAQTLQPAYERLYFVQTVLPQLCNIVVASMGLFALAMWVRRRAEPTYVVFFVFSELWALRATHTFIRDIPISAFHWDIWVQSSFGWCALLFIVHAMRYCGLRWPRFEKLMLAYALSGPVLMYCAGPEHLHAVASNWSFVLVPLGFVFEAFLIRAAWQQRTKASVLLAAVWALIVLASVHDGFVHRDKLDFDSFYLVSYAMVLLSFVMGWILTDRFVTALKMAEELNRDLEQRVADKHAELEENFKRLRAMERESAMAAERSRITSEMHDGIGSQLIATLDLVEQGNAQQTEIAAELREALDSLRLTIDSLEPSDNDLLSVLGNLRYRLEGRLKRQGVALDWRVRDLPGMPSLTPQNVMHILRILQEAFTNILKHAQARNIAVETGVEERHVFIRISDDGRGFSGTRQGRGLVYMRRRAQALDAELDIRSEPGDTVLELKLPLAA